MNETFYFAEQNFLENYLRERASMTAQDKCEIDKAMALITVPKPGSPEAVNEIYSVDRSVATIRIEGILSPEGADFWDRFFDIKATSYATIQAAMIKAKNDISVNRVELHIDSPGGSVDGCDETWQQLKLLNEKKPTTVWVGGMCASAAYYIASAANAIYANAPTSEIGSIGVLYAAYDWSKWEEKIGVKEIVITSSNAPDKAPDISTQKGQDTIRERLNALERIFYSRVSEGRKVTNEHIAEHFGRGGLLVAADPSPDHEDALRVGMIDNVILSIDKRPDIDGCTGRIVTKATNNSETVFNSAPAENNREVQDMNLNELLKANPDAKAEHDKAVAEAKTAGAQEANAAIAARVDKVLPIIESASYPANIKTIACNVLSGKEEMSAFTAAVSVYDSVTEAANSEAAKNHTDEIGGVGAQAPDFKPVGEKELDAAIQAELGKLKKEAK